MADDPYFAGVTPTVRCVQCGHTVDDTTDARQEHADWHEEMSRPPAAPADVDV